MFFFPASECQSSSPKGRSSSENAQGNQPSTTSSNNAMPIKSDCGIQLLSGMPCVSATGNGPNGKTINGLLCKYNNKTEISIGSCLSWRVI
ncbi:hypothetical protein HAX54_016121 [Datura stramonium]|uniref:Ninja-family protein n=1 Tax=Datura stramonium TaxID=4076 RepID=A0ABS8S361_DATST|nr:hypothetical protein [Datura stramonium]